MTAHDAFDRLAAVRSLLQVAGIDGEVDAAGTDGEIAAIRGEAGARARLARLAPEIRSLGFRYVALEPRVPNDDNEDT